MVGDVLHYGNSQYAVWLDVRSHKHTPILNRMLSCPVVAVLRCWGETNELRFVCCLV